MAERRMFAKTIIDSDAFLDMPLSAQALYFHLSMRADDDGFVNNPKKIQRMVGASDDDCKLLVIKRFILTFDSGVIVIKHWKIHNYIQKDRYKETIYLKEKASLSINGINGYTECIHNVSKTETQVSIGKVSIGKDSKEKEIINNNINNYGEATKDEKGEKIFKQMLYEISEDIAPLTYETFFKNLKFGGIADDCIVIETVSLYRDYIEKNHKEILIDALKVASEDTLKGVIWEI